MSSIMRWRNGLMALSVMAIAPVSHEVTNPVILRQDEPTCYPAIQHASRTLRRGAPTASGLVHGVETDLAIGFAPDKADRQSSAQFTARRLVANAAVEAGPQDMQLGFAHGALEPEQEAIVEEGGMIDAVGVADQRIGEAAQLDEAMPIGVVACQARDLEPEHEADVGEGDFGGEPGETRSRDKAGAGEPEVLIDDHDAIGGP